MKPILSFLVLSTLACHGATLALYEFTHAANDPTPLTATTIGTNMTLTDVTLVGGSLQDNTANILRISDTPTNSFSNTTNHVWFRLDADAGYFFDLTSGVGPTLQFQIARNSGSTPLIGRMEIYGATSGAATIGSTLLHTSSEASASSSTMVTMSDTAGIAAINNSNQYTSLLVQIQWRTSATPDSSVYRFDNFRIDGALTQVPEPSSALLGGLGMLALLRRRRIGRVQV